MFSPLIFSLLLLAPRTDTTGLEEHFIDSVHIGRARHNKVEVLQYHFGDDSIYSEVRFYSRVGKRWLLRQQFRWRKYRDLGCEPQLRDFNHDGKKDLTCISRDAARGANEMRRLYLYDERKDLLVYIRNSDEYPNLQYNPYLHCIDSWAVYGGVCTHFLRVRGNLLREFANVEVYDGVVTVSEMDARGKERVIRRFKTKNRDLDFARFSNYKPLW